jgi:hypothetical protein
VTATITRTIGAGTITRITGAVGAGTAIGGGTVAGVAGTAAGDTGTRGTIGTSGDPEERGFGPFLFGTAEPDGAD